MFVEVLMNLLCIRYVDTTHRGEKALEIKVCTELSSSVSIKKLSEIFLLAQNGNKMLLVNVSKLYEKQN